MPNRQSAIRPSPGFTLIELLVVIAIISLLASILLPSLSRAKELTRRVVCATNLRNIGQAVSMYAIECKAVPPEIGPSYVYYINAYWDYNFGPLCDDGKCISDDRTLYCPATTLNTYDSDATKTTRRSSYLYRYVNMFNESGKAIACDRYGYQLCWHVLGWNILYQDNSVNFFTDTEAVFLLQEPTMGRNYLVWSEIFDYAY